MTDFLPERVNDLCGSRDDLTVEATAPLTPNEADIWEAWAAEQRAEQAKRWAIVAVVVANDNDGIVLNFGGFGDYAFEGVGSHCSDEGLEVPKLDVGLYYVSDIGIRADEEDFEAWGTWTLIDPLTRDAAIAKALGEAA